MAKLCGGSDGGGNNRGTNNKKNRWIFFSIKVPEGVSCHLHVLKMECRFSYRKTDKRYLGWQIPALTTEGRISN
jgi:hypothetical protein